MTIKGKAFSAALHAVGLSALVVGVFGCASDQDPIKPTEVRKDTPDVVGVFVTDAAVSVYASATRFSVGSDGFDVVKINSAGDYAVLHNDPGNAKNGGKFSRFDWTVDVDKETRFCVAVGEAKSDSEAAAVEPNAFDMDKGCGGNAWEFLTPPSIIGRYTDDWEGQHDITAVAWTTGYVGSEQSVFWLRELSNTAGYLLAANDEKNSFNPGLFSRYDFVVDADKTLYYCQTSYNAATLAAAKATTPADRTDLVMGCGGGNSWSKLTVKK